MVMKSKEIQKDGFMNRKAFVETLEKRFSYSHEVVDSIVSILENYFIFKKSELELARCEMKEKLGLSEEESLEVMETIQFVLKSEIKKKIRHPFRNKKM